MRGQVRKTGKEPGWRGGTTRGELKECQNNHGRVVPGQMIKMRRKIWQTDAFFVGGNHRISTFTLKSSVHWRNWRHSASVG